MNKRLVINYNWDLSDFPNIKEKKKQRLIQEAESRIAEQHALGIIEGELHYEDNKGRRYWGWFSIKYVEVTEDVHA